MFPLQKGLSICVAAPHFLEGVKCQKKNKEKTGPTGIPLFAWIK